MLGFNFCTFLINETSKAAKLTHLLLDAKCNASAKSILFSYHEIAEVCLPIRTRYFTDSGIIGTKEYVSISYKRFKGIFMSKREKIPKPVAGLDGVYSLKRLAES